MSNTLTINLDDLSCSKAAMLKQMIDVAVNTQPIVEQVITDLPPPDTEVTVVPVVEMPPPETEVMVVPVVETPPTVVLTDGDVDSAGVAWDERLHAGTKTKKADGTWKKRKGVKAADVAAVAAEQVATAPAVAAVPDINAAAAASQQAPAASQQAPAVAVAPVAPVAPAVPGGDALTWPVFLSKVTTSGKGDQATLAAMATALGLGQFADLVSRPDLLPAALITLGLE